MSELEEIKEDIKFSLEETFIEHKDEVEKEMGLLNTLVTSFSGKEYDYNEYCRCKLQFQLEACDKHLKGIDFEEEAKFTPQEENIVRQRAARKHFKNTELDPDEIMKEEYIKWQVEKNYLLDQKIFYNVCYFSMKNLIVNKIGKEMFEEKKIYFYNIIKDKAKKIAEEIAKKKKKDFEQSMRSPI